MNSDQLADALRVLLKRVDVPLPDRPPRPLPRRRYGRRTNPRREVAPPAAESLAPAAHRSEPERAAGFGEKLALDGRRGLATLAIRLPEQAHRQLDLSLGQRLALQWLVGLRAGQTERPGPVVAHGKY
jgi:hypothetical protein